ncbi:MAG TPA: transglycosylase domain-containing protein [Candidatus Binatia bacterium]|nr:transglycosylase domain-containing protein [Candidatus Binatia bacterium]
MAENSQFPGWLKRFYRGLALHFRAACDPASSLRVRLLHAAKGFARLGALGLSLACAYAFILIPFTPSISNIRKAKIDQPAVLMSSDGRRLATLKPMNRQWVGLNQISPHVIHALLATEDHRFYRHYGIDLWRTTTGVLRAFIGDLEGGSTLTQQLARNLYPEEIGRKRTVTRKIKETITAIKIEYAYTKNEILETYLNTMPFLYNAFGIEMAARTYFDKPAQKLTILESATLIAMLKGTSYYNPVLNPERSLRRRNVVLSQMVKRGVLSQGDFDRLKTRPIRLDFERQPESVGPAPHLAGHIRKWLIDWADRNDRNIYSDGLIVHTTIDSRLQTLANQAVHRQMESLQAVADVEWGVSSPRLISPSANTYVDMRRRVQPFSYFWRAKPGLIDVFVRESAAYRRAVDSGSTPKGALAQLKNNREFMTKLRADKTRLQAGFLAIDPATGHVKAWVGSRDFNTDQFDHVAQARRQPGSTFKAFVYGAALEHGMSPDRRFTDRAVEIPLPDGTVWRPSDLSEPSGRRMTLREGLIYSKNTITAQVMQEIGPKRAAELARKMGVKQSKLDEVPALALGTSPVTLFEMVAGFSTIAALGEYRQPIFITHITDKNGNLLAQFATGNERVLSDKTVEDLVNMLRGAIDQGTGQAVRTQFGIRADVAGKTGTTQKNTDGWFILMHRRLVAGSWVGFNDSRITMRSNHWGEGRHNALLLVGDFFQQTLSAGLIDGSAGFPFERPHDSFWEPYLDSAKEWLGGIFRDWVFGEKAKPAPLPPPAARRDLGREAPRDRLEDSQEQRRLERQREKDRLLERLRQKQEQRQREYVD